MILTKSIVLQWTNSNKKLYINKGYTFTKLYDYFKISISDLSQKSSVKITVQCDCCKKKKKLSMADYTQSLKQNKYYCHTCSLKLFGKNKTYKTKLQKSKSFYDWCVENNKQDLLDRWDYELNKCNPKEVCFGSGVKYYFKCKRGLHKSELKCIHSITKNYIKSSDCIACNSFAQWGIDNICSDFLEKYWDYNKNKEIDPWKIHSQSNINIWIKCQKHNYHGSYMVSCGRFYKGNRCPYCRGFKVKIFDSLGWLYPEAIKYWSDKNKKSPYEYPPMSKQKVFWECPEKQHKDYYRKISDSIKCNFRCPECEYSKGEERIEKYLLDNNIIYLGQYSFNNLFGIKGGLLSYDFYIPDKKLLIEYQGIQHKKPIDFHGMGIEYAKEQFKQQQEHDKRKRQYAKENSIELLEIWYWDYNNIEKILEHELRES